MPQHDHDDPDKCSRCAPLMAAVNAMLKMLAHPPAPRVPTELPSAPPGVPVASCCRNGCKAWDCPNL